MSTHRTTLTWKFSAESFDYEHYNRAHEWVSETGIKIPASAASEYKGEKDRLNPEEALVGALSSCHMLTFLAIAAKKRFTVLEYTDSAEGTLEKNEHGKLAITNVNLRPKTRFGGDKQPTREELEALHKSAHDNCFIANSVTTKVHIILE